MTVRASQHSGRGYSDRHNDRNFDLEKAPHIDSTKTPDNIYWVWADDELDDEDRKQFDDVKTFADWELEYYKFYFEETLEKTNDNYIRNYHPERCKTIEDVLAAKSTGPEEVILQIGDFTDGVSPEIFKDCALEYFDYLKAWNEQTGNHMALLDMAIHVDEASPHMQLRRTWQYEKNPGSGVYAIGQNKALEQAGVELPDPSKKESRNNNRKMTFDKMMREKWIEIIENHGFEVEKTPKPKKTHVTKAEYIRQQEQELADSKAELTALKADLAIEREKIQIIKENTLKNEIRAKNAYSDAEDVLTKARNILQGANDHVATMVAPPGLEEFCKTYKRRIAKTKMKDVGTALKPDYKRVYDLDKDGKKQYEEHNCFDDWQAQQAAKHQTDRLTHELLDQADEMLAREKQQKSNFVDFEL